MPHTNINKYNHTYRDPHTLTHKYLHKKHTKHIPKPSNTDTLSQIERTNKNKYNHIKNKFTNKHRNYVN